MILYKDEYYKIVGAAMSVHKTLGCGFLEAVYQDALAFELGFAGIPYKKEVQFNITYKNNILNKYYIADFTCYDKIIIETKAVKELDPIHEAQVINYLKISGYRLGILINFGSTSLEIKRIIL